MKIDFSAVLTTLGGEPIPTNIGQPEGETVPLTLATASVVALMRSEQKDDGKIKFDLYKLALRVGDGGVVEIEPKDAELIKTRIGQAWSPLIVGRCWEILNG